MPRMMAGLVLSLFLTSAVSAEVYTWIDSRGVAHFSDYPPGEIPHKQLDVQAPVTVPMSENLGQGKRVSGIRKEVEGLLASGRPTGSGATAKEKADAELEAGLAAADNGEMFRHVIPLFVDCLLLRYQSISSGIAGSACSGPIAV